MSALLLARLDGQLAVDGLVCRNRRPVASLSPCDLERDAVVDVGFAVAEQLVEEAAHLTRVARDFGHAFLVGVQLLEGRHRQEDVVLLEAEQAGRIVHQHVGVEHEQLGAGVQAGDGGGFALGT